MQQILQIDLAAGSIVQAFIGPPGIDLSADNQTLYAALHGLGDVAVLDTNSGTRELIDISVALDDDRTWDVVCPFTSVRDSPRTRSTSWMQASRACRSFSKTIMAR